jgi:hypothetical protein
MPTIDQVLVSCALQVCVVVPLLFGGDDAHAGMAAAASCMPPAALSSSR